MTGGSKGTKKGRKYGRKKKKCEQYRAKVGKPRGRGVSGNKRGKKKLVKV